MAYEIRNGFAATALALVLAGAHPAAATPISPTDAALSLLGSLPGGNLSVDTGANGDAGSLPTLTFGGGTLFGDIVSQAGGPDIAVFLFDGGAVFGAGNSLTATGGSRPLALLFNGAARIEGDIDVSGGAANVNIPGSAIAGGGAGGGAGTKFSRPSAGSGPGGGTAGSSSASTSGNGSGAGGGFGTAGGNGGAGNTTAAGGTAYGDPLRDLLQGGSGGGGGGGDPLSNRASGAGGAGGGGIEIGALGELVLAGGSILANGGTGGDGNRDGGGGSGGGILLHAFDIVLDATSLLQANGAAGGDGVNIGGCGGAGRIEAITNISGSLSAAGTVEALGFGPCDDGVLATAQLAGIGVPPSDSSFPVPEPPSLALFAIAAAILGAARRRTRARR